MKIKAIASICKKSKCVFLYDQPGEDYVAQWVGDGKALYPIVNVPYMETDNLCTIFEYTDKQQNDFVIRHAGIPDNISIENTDPTEKAIQSENIQISYGGRMLKPLHSSKGLIFIDTMYLSPLADIRSIMQFFERTTSGGVPYIVVKAGFLIHAVIMTYDAINETFVKIIEKLSRESRIAYNRKEYEKNIIVRTEPTQQTMNFNGDIVDTDTGEIIETLEEEENQCQNTH